MWKKLEYSNWNLINDYCQIVDCVDDTVNPILLFLWRKINNIEIIIEDKWILIKGNYEGTNFIFRPLCSEENVFYALERIEELINEKFVLSMCHNTLYKHIKRKKQSVKLIEEDYAQYIYPANYFLTFAGRKMQKKRNQLNNFLKLHRNKKIECKLLCDININEVINFHKKWTKENIKEDEYYFLTESEGCLDLLMNYESHKSDGLVILIENKIVGYSMITTACDYGIYNIEKANSKIKGLYQFMQKEVAIKFWNKPGIKWVSREDDVGDLKIRKSKLSYHPVLMSERKTISWKL